MSDSPWLWLLAGPNGAGKSTYAPNLSADVQEIVRPDEIPYQLSPRSRFTRGPAGPAPRGCPAEERRSFAVETTLSGRFHLRMAERAKSEGWNLGVIYVGISRRSWLSSVFTKECSQVAITCRQEMFDGDTDEACEIWWPSARWCKGCWRWTTLPQEDR